MPVAAVVASKSQPPSAWQDLSTRGRGPGTWDPEPGTWDLEPDHFGLLPVALFEQRASCDSFAFIMAPTYLRFVANAVYGQLQ